MLWWMAGDKLKTRAGTKYGYKPDDTLYLKDIPSLQKYRMNVTNGDGPRGQHSLYLKDNGNLLMFDNRSQGDINKDGSRAVEYSFDGMNAALVREFIDKDKTYSRYTSDFDITPEGSWLVYYANSSPHKKIFELDDNNNILYHKDSSPIKWPN